MERSKHMKKLRIQIGKEKRIYEKDEIKDETRFKMGSKIKACKYQKEDGEKICKMCKEKDGKHRKCGGAMQRLERKVKIGANEKKKE